VTRSETVSLAGAVTTSIGAEPMGRNVAHGVNPGDPDSE
jgi:hypothetical protein